MSTPDYDDPIWKLRLREAGEKLAALKNLQQLKRDASLARPEHEDAPVTEWPQIKSETVGK